MDKLLSAGGRGGGGGRPSRCPWPVLAVSLSGWPAKVRGYLVPATGIAGGAGLEPPLGAEAFRKRSCARPGCRRSLCAISTRPGSLARGPSTRRRSCQDVGGGPWCLCGVPPPPFAAGGSFSWATALALEGPEEQGWGGGPPVCGAGSRPPLPQFPGAAQHPWRELTGNLGPRRELFELGETEAYPRTIPWLRFQSSRCGARV